MIKYILNKTINMGKYFACLAGQAAGSPLVDRAITREIVNLRSMKERTGDSVLIRLPFTGKNKPTVGIVFGRWRTCA